MTTKNRTREADNALAREAMVYGDVCMKAGNVSQACAWYLKASREGARKAIKKYNNALKLLNQPALSTREIRAAQQRLEETNRKDSSPTIQPSLPIPKEDERMLVGVISATQSDNNRKKKQNSQVKGNESQGVPQTNDATNAETLYQQGRAAEKQGKISKAHSLYKESAQKGHRGAQLALGKMYLEKALKLLGDSRIDIDSLMALILNQETNSCGGADAAANVQRKREAVRSHQSTTKQRQRETEDTTLTPTVVLPNHAPGIPVPAEKPEQPQYKAWVHTPGTDAEASIEIDSIPEAPTDTEGSGEPLSGWAMEGTEVPEEAAEEPTPELKCAQTESSGCEIGETEEKSIDLSPPAPPARMGCFFCRLRDKLSSFFSQQVKR